MRVCLMVAGAFLAMASTTSAQELVQIAAAQPENCLDYTGTDAQQWKTVCSIAIESGRLESRELAMARLNRGAAYVAMGDTSRAAIDYGEAVRLTEVAMDPARPDAASFFRRGMALHALGQIDRAQRDYDEALRLEPDNVLAIINRGIILSTRKGDYRAAIADFDKALQLRPEAVGALIYRGEAYAKLGRFGPSLADLDRAIELAPGNAEARVFRGLTHARRGNPRLASADYAAALEIDPRNVDALVNRAAIHATRGEYVSAVAALDTAIELRPDNTLAWYNRGYVKFAQKQYEAAIADYSNALARDPMLVAAYVNRCLARVLAGQDPRLAVVDCDVALRAMPNNLDARETRGFIHLKLGDTETALAEYGASLELDPNRPLALYGRGLAKIRKGDKAGGEADRAAARALHAGIDGEFSRYGLN